MEDETAGKDEYFFLLQSNGGENIVLLLQASFPSPHLTADEVLFVVVF